MARDLVLRTWLADFSNETVEAVKDSLSTPEISTYCEITKILFRPGIFELSISLRDSEISAKEFDDFCAQSGFDCDSTSPTEEAAALFLANKWGRDLFVIKLPPREEDQKKAVRAISGIAREFDLELYDPYTRTNIM